MKTTKMLAILVMALGLFASPVELAGAAPMGTAFTYQGRLIDANKPADGLYDLQFKLYDDNVTGTQKGSTITVNELDVVDGSFIVYLYFGSDVFDGDARWLEIGIRPGEQKDPNAYTTQSPRLEVTPTPYALYADNADKLDGNHSSAFAWKTHSHYWLDAADGNPTNALYIDNEGNVGIGTTTPSAKLTVEGGTIKATNSLDYSMAIYGVASGDDGVGVYGWSGSGTGVCGESIFYAGVYGKSISGYGVRGVSSSADGVCGKSSSAAGVYGKSISGYGVCGESSSAAGVYGWSGSGYAGLFDGDVHVTGNLSKSSGSFKIDHPLDPEHKFLQHSFVESPDMMNIYNGNIILDENGEALVTLPEWFQSLNKEFRYQLTCVGGFAPVYIAEKISDNHFKIAGGKPRMEVSWQVTGIRQDPYAVANRIVVETAKAPDEIGRYLHPEAYGLPKEKGIETVHNPELRQSRQLAREAGAP